MKNPSYRIVAAALLSLPLLAIPVILHGARPAAPLAPLPDDPFIDMHCHVAGIGAGGSGCFVSDRMLHSYKLGFYLRSFGVTRAELERDGDAVVIDRLSARLAASTHVSRAVVLALDGVVDAQGGLDRAQTEVYVPNEYLAREIPRHPNLLWGASVNPFRPDALERLEWARDHGAVLVKWLPATQHIDPADPRLVPYYKKLVELGLPLLTHTGNERSFTASSDDLGDPARLRLALDCGVTVIAAHVATTGQVDGERCIDRLAVMMEGHPNLYADISSLTQCNKLGYLREVISRPEFRGRIVYGTDYPLVAIPALVSPWYQAGRLPFAQIRACCAQENLWDRDVAIKQAMGVPADTWHRAETILALTPRTRPPQNPAP